MTSWESGYSYWYFLSVSPEYNMYCYLTDVTDTGCGGSRGGRYMAATLSLRFTSISTAKSITDPSRLTICIKCLTCFSQSDRAQTPTQVVRYTQALFWMSQCLTLILFLRL